MLVVGDEQKQQEDIVDGWQDAIDIDDSDLPSLFLPLRPCSSLTPNPNPQPLADSTDRPRSIPGPAGTVQSAMHRRVGAYGANGSEEEQRSDVDLDFDLGDEEDEDFKLHPWICALRFLGPDVDLVSPICSIRTRDVEKVPKTVAIVKSCKPNGLGDLFISLKDPTGSIGASVHNRVLLEQSLGGNISVGCVLILKQVVAFSPTRSARYLNVTINNVVKLFDKDCGAPEKQPISLFTTKWESHGKHKETMLSRGEQEPPLWKMAGTGDNDETTRNLSFNKFDNCDLAIGSRTLLANPKTNGEQGAKLVDNEIGATAEERNVRQRLVHEEPKEKTASPVLRDRSEAYHSLSFPFKTVDTSGTNPVTSSDQDLAIDTEIELGLPEMTSQYCKAKAVGESGNISNSESVLGALTENSLPCSTKISTTPVPAKSVFLLNDTKVQISKETVGQWTDEQLMELFADFQDDAGLLLPII